jgi:hypothetical protein
MQLASENRRPSLVMPDVQNVDRALCCAKTIVHRYRIANEPSDPCLFGIDDPYLGVIPQTVNEIKNRVPETGCGLRAIFRNVIGNFVQIS